MDLDGGMDCTKFSIFYHVVVVRFDPDFPPNADGSVVLEKLTPVHNEQGGGGENKQKLDYRGPIFADFWPIF